MEAAGVMDIGSQVGEQHGGAAVPNEQGARVTVAALSHSPDHACHGLNFLQSFYLFFCVFFSPFHLFDAIDFPNTFYPFPHPIHSSLYLLLSLICCSHLPSYLLPRVLFALGIRPRNDRSGQTSLCLRTGADSHVFALRPHAPYLGSALALLGFPLTFVRPRLPASSL